MTLSTKIGLATKTTKLGSLKTTKINWFCNQTFPTFILGAFAVLSNQEDQKSRVKIS